MSTVICGEKMLWENIFLKPASFLKKAKKKKKTGLSVQLQKALKLLNTGSSDIQPPLFLSEAATAFGGWGHVSALSTGLFHAAPVQEVTTLRGAWWDSVSTGPFSFGLCFTKRGNLQDVIVHTQSHRKLGLKFEEDRLLEVRFECMLNSILSKRHLSS